MKLQTILVAVDGSEGAQRAVVWAAHLARSTGAEVVVVHARGLLESMSHDAALRSFETDWCSPLDAANVHYRRVLRDGDPVTVILASAEEEDADVIVIGSRGLGAYPEQLLGSTSTQVAQRSTRPVTIVPSGVAR